MPVYAAKKNKWTAKDVPLAEPTATYMFAHRDTCDLLLDYYKATPGSATEIDGKKKPAIIFSFGGGFVSGNRDKPHYQQWIKQLNDNGYLVFSISVSRTCTPLPITFSSTPLNSVSSRTTS